MRGGLWCRKKHHTRSSRKPRHDLPVGVMGRPCRTQTIWRAHVCCPASPSGVGPVIGMQQAVTTSTLVFWCGLRCHGSDGKALLMGLRAIGAASSTITCQSLFTNA